MLTSLTVLNSKVFGKAEIRLNDCDSLQLVGPNNIGKSTLIYALNFLFIIDGNKMTFSGQRKGDKETLHHYFPNPNQSYIVFEIFKKSYYCILVKRTTDSDLEYYRFNSEYKESFFVDADKKLLKFDEVQEGMVAQGIELIPFKDKREVFNMVYQRGRRNNAVVWLEDNVKTDGLSNNFSRIYRYLINTKLITNKNLKEALIVADNRENEGLNFSQKNKKDIIDLRKINNEIRNLKSVKGEFDEFREIVNYYDAKTRIINQLYDGFTVNYDSTMPTLQSQLVDRNQNIARINAEINEGLIPQKADFDRKIGGKDIEIQNRAQLLNEKEIEVNVINSYDPLELLNESLMNWDQKRKEVESRITTVEIQKLNRTQIEHKVLQLRDSISRSENQIKNYGDLLINKISGNKENRKLLNAILSEQVKSLPGEQVLKVIHEVSKNFKIFDGEIDLSENIVLQDFKSVEEISEELNEIKIDLKNQEALLEVVKDIEKSQNELAKINAEIDEIKGKILRIHAKPLLLSTIEKLKEDLYTLNEEKQKLEAEQNKLAQSIAKCQLEVQDLIGDKDKRESRIKVLQEYKQILDGFNLEREPFETSDDLDNLYKKMQINISDKHDLKLNKNNLFDKLKSKLQSTFADEQDFIKYVEEEIALIEDKERSISSLLENISVQFANPAYNLLKRYDEFKEFVYNKFNTRLSQARISDIESLTIELMDNKKLVDELKKISQIQQVRGQMMFDFDHSENLKVLDNYLDSGKRIGFDDLFDITLHLTRKGITKNVDLNEQIESDGTDKMIRLIIIMNIINRLAINDDENRIALFIDEVATIDKHNRPELVRFCKEHHFIPIFAAPDAVAGFGKYYFIYPSSGKINVNEKVNAMYGERKTSAVS